MSQHPADSGAAASNMGRRRAAAAVGGRENYQDRRLEIVEAAVALFRERGYRRTSLSDIAGEIGSERASLYYYFSSKEEILNEAVTPVVLRNTARAEELRDAPDPAPVKLRRLITELLTSYGEHYPLLFLYLEENLSDVAKSSQGWATQMRAVNRRFEGALEEIIRQGIADGSLRALADPQILANGLMGTVSWTHRWFSPRTSSASAAAIGAAYADLLLGGLMTSPGETSAAGEPAWRAAADPDVLRVTARFEAAGVPPYHQLSIGQARELMTGVTRLQAPKTPVARIGDLLVPGAAGQLPARVYHPAPGQRLPLVIYLHGGGWALGGITEADQPCRRLAAASGCVVVAVEYRLAPETKFPGPLEDCVAAARWLASPDGASAVGTDGEHVVLLGDSAGGNLAAAAALTLRDAGKGARLTAQILLYPCLAPARQTTFASYRQYAGGPLMTRAEMDWFWDQYLRTEADGQDPRAAPLLAGDVSGLPPALVVVAELDPLRDEGLAYAERLRAAAVRTESAVYRGAAHGFWWMDGAMHQAAELDAQLARYLRTVCAEPPARGKQVA